MTQPGGVHRRRRAHLEGTPRQNCPFLRKHYSVKLCCFVNHNNKRLPYFSLTYYPLQMGLKCRICSPCLSKCMQGAL